MFQLLNSEEHIDDGQFGEEKVQGELSVDEVKLVGGFADKKGEFIAIYS